MNRKAYWVLLVIVSLLPAAITRAQPANDNFANAWTIAGVTIATNGTVAGATRETGEPNHTGAASGHSVWFNWTAPGTGPYQIDTLFSSFDTVLAVYTGSRVGALTLVAANDDYQSASSLVEIQAVEGTVYRIAVDAFGGSAGGNYVLHVRAIATLAISSINNGMIVRTGTLLPIDVSGDIPLPPITRVDFYQNGLRFGSDAVAPFSAVASNMTAGVTSFSVVAFDSSGLSWTSSVTTVTVVDPGVTIISPRNGYTFLSSDPGKLLPDGITIEAYAWLPRGQITNVQFFVDGQKFAETSNGALTQFWTNVTGGLHQLTAIGFSDTGAIYRSPAVNISVNDLFISRGSVWKYLDNGSNQGANWISGSFNDTSWAAGPAEFGYGDGDERTVINGGPTNNHFITTYFRRSFVVTNLAGYQQFILGIKVDDGAVLYINGRELGRLNLPSGTITYTTLAFDSFDDGTVFYGGSFPQNFLVEGTNVVAVEVHQSSPTSSDVSFDLDMAGLRPVPPNSLPTVTITSPTNDSVYVLPSAVTLSANAADPDGIARVEFFADGLKLGESTNAPYSFDWTSPPLGRHSLTAGAVDGRGARVLSAAVSVTIYDEAHTPYAAIVTPPNGTIVEGPIALTVSAYASAIEGVTNVLFLANGLSIGEVANPPYSVTWGAPFGSYALQAIAFGFNGLQGTSAVSTVVITIPPTNTVAPFISLTAPAAFANVSNTLTGILVRFSERVQGVDAGDLMINGIPATGVSGSGSNYLFTFPQPAYGEVSVAFLENSGITDFGWPSVLPFDGTNARWEYQFYDGLGPTILARSPAAGTTVTNLTQVSVTFSEPVSGVDAEDLLANGTPAFGMSGSGTNYTFSVSQPSSGIVNITWATNNGIIDQALYPNAFDGTAAAWSLTLDARQVLVQSNGMWRFQKGTAEASSPVSAWRQPNYEAGDWPLSPAPFFYGDTGYTNALIPGTYLGDMRSNYSSIFLRTEFVVGNASSIESLLLNAQFDDGFIAWVNGVEAVRVNMPPAGEVPVTGTATTSSLEPLGNGAVYVVNILSNSPAHLVNGTNILAVQVFNQSLAGSDFGWNAQLYAFLTDVGFRAPRIAQVTPPAGTVFTLSNVTIRFTEPVTGVDASDLLINGVAANSVSNNSSSIYTFSFPQPSFGPIDLSWASGHGIFDQDETPKPFDGNANSARVHYTLLNPSSPIVVTQAPPAGATITNLAGITVRFSEPVSGVDPSDLLVNGQPAATVQQVNSTNYLFTVASPPYGPVAVTWSSAHGIRDLENPPNAFDPTRPGGTWSYNLVDPVPSIALIAPADNAAFLVGTNVTIRAIASDSDGTIARVDFFANGSGIGGVTTAPYTITWSNLVEGEYALRAVAVDNIGLRSTSAPVSITVITSLPIALVRGPYLQVGAPTGGVVRWRTDLPSDAVVYYGIDANSLTEVMTVPESTNEHIVPISGLAPETKYYYSIGSSNQRLARGTNYWFKTPPLAGTKKPTRFWVLGDSGTANDNARNVRDAYYQFAATNRPADFWLMLGDNAYNSGLDPEYQAAVFDMYPETLRNLFLWPTIGNHETQQAFTAEDFPYLHIFTLPQNGEAGGVSSGSPRYYSFDYANIHFVCLDSMSSGRTTNTAMVHWLVNDLEATSQEWVIVFFHHPPYTRGNHNSDFEGELIEIRQNIVPILESHGVDLVLCGHSHALERSYLLNGHYGLSSTFSDSMKVDAGNGREDGNGVYRKNLLGQGVVYTVAGSSGQITGGQLNHPAHYISLNELGSMVIDVNSNRLDAMFLSANGVSRDHFTLVKRASPTPPINLVATAVSTNQISLIWNDFADDRTGFAVERSLDGTNFTRVSTVASNASAFIDHGLLGNTTYFYRVRAVNFAAESDPSNIASSTTVNAQAPPLAPASLVASADNGLQFYRSQMVLRWRDRSPNEAGFIVERSSDGVTFVQIGSVAVNVSHYIDRNLDSATTYYYRVRAFNSFGPSLYSNLANEQTHPQDTVAFAGTPVTLHAGSEGQGTIRYQWRFEGALVVGATNEAFVLNSVQSAHEGSYTVEITDANGRVVSNPAYLLVASPPFFVTEPASRTNFEGSMVVFTASAGGDAPLGYQWRKDGTPLAGATGSILSLGPVNFSDQGGYDVVVENDLGSAISRTALLVVRSMPPPVSFSTIERWGTAQIRLSFTALADQRCSVLFAPTLNGPWSSVTNYPTFATSQLVQSVFPIAGTNGFFQLQVLP